jgi:hypothetical protein
MLFILGHGEVVGTETLLFDAHAEKNSVSLAELGEVLRAFNSDVQNDTEPGQVEMITLHSCSMSSLEVAYEFKGAARYLLASQGPTYVGNLPYKQILIRIFNDLNLQLTAEDINGVHEGKDGKQSFLEKLSQPSEPVSEFFNSKLSETLKKYVPGTRPEPSLVSEVVADLNKLTMSNTLIGELKKLSSGNGTRPQKNGQFVDLANRRRRLRLFLADKYPEIARYPRHSIDDKLRKIFYYCLYNSLDYQLAGYPFDLCLTNLTKVSESEEPMKRLVDSLSKGLNMPKAKQLILLAHWDAQSFYSEDYVDLYDFCCCFRRRCAEIDAVAELEELYNACGGMIDVLEKGPDKLITNSAFAGAAFQYSHGHSIYFPWARPVDNKAWEEQYENCRLNKKTGWGDFLNQYFDKTRRQTRSDEEKDLGEKRDDDGTKDPTQGMSTMLLNMIGRIGSRVFVDDGGLLKPGPDHPMGKWGPDDPSGANCDCPKIKNYPPFTSFVSDDFFHGVEIAKDAEES